MSVKTSVKRRNNTLQRAWPRKRDVGSSESRTVRPRREGRSTEALPRGVGHRHGRRAELVGLRAARSWHPSLTQGGPAPDLDRRPEAPARLGTGHRAPLGTRTAAGVLGQMPKGAYASNDPWGCGRAGADPGRGRHFWVREGTRHRREPRSTLAGPIPEPITGHPVLPARPSAKRVPQRKRYLRGVGKVRPQRRCVVFSWKSRLEKSPPSSVKHSGPSGRPKGRTTPESHPGWPRPLPTAPDRPWAPRLGRERFGSSLLAANTDAREASVQRPRSSPSPGQGRRLGPRSRDHQSRPPFHCASPASASHAPRLAPFLAQVARPLSKSFRPSPAINGQGRGSRWSV